MRSMLFRRHGLVLLPLVLALLLLHAAPLSAQQPSLAFQRAQHLRRGINTSKWFAQAPGHYTVQHLRSFTTADDLTLIHKLGFDHIRLSVDATPLLAWQRKTPDGLAFVAELDRVLDTAQADQLAVIVDIHPESAFKQTLLHQADSVERFAALWHDLADHLSHTNRDLVFFEILNEPEQPDTFRWQGIQSAVLAQIRQVAPLHTVIATGARWSGLTDLLDLQPLADNNVIYTFHDYEPFPFTHQGATWTDPRAQPLRHVPYPSTPENVVPNQAQEPTLAGQLFIQQYGLDRWDATRIDHTLAFAQQWGQQHHVPIFCGEFGVHQPFADPAMRAAWTHDMRVALEAHNIGWDMWDYQDNFGLVTKPNGHAVPDPLLVRALGLQPAP